MTLGFRGKLFVLSFGLVLLVAAISGVFLETSLRGWLMESQEEDLVVLTRSVQSFTELHLSERGERHLQTHMAKLGRTVGVRVTVIEDGGRVTADSALPDEDVRSIGDHSQRPEVLQAQREGVGRSKRFSRTLNTEMLYVAVPYSTDRGSGVVRVAKAAEDVDAVIGTLRGLIGFGVALGILVALMMGALASRFAARSLEELVVKAQAASRSQGHKRIDLQSTGDVAGLAGSFNRLAGDLERAVTDLATERDRAAAVFEGLADGVLAIDDKALVTAANDASVKLLELEQSPVGQAFLDVVRLPGLMDAVRAAQSGEAAASEVHIDGPPARLLEIKATPQRAPGHCVLLLRDVTELRRLEAVRRDFVANVSHELRTPLSILSINAETLMDAGLDTPSNAAKRRELIEGMQRHARRLGDLVGDLLDLSRIEAGRYPLEIVEIEAAETAGAIVDLCEPRARRAKLGFEVELEDDLRVRADAKALEQVLHNLVENAIKYSPEGAEVGLRAARKGAVVRFEVWDTGAGVAEAHRARLFERFYRVDEGRSREMGGTGLGLSIVKHLVDAMGGTVGMLPNREGGSLFWVELPAA